MCMCVCTPIPTPIHWLTLSVQLRNSNAKLSLCNTHALVVDKSCQQCLILLLLLLLRTRLSTANNKRTPTFHFYGPNILNSDVGMYICIFHWCLFFFLHIFLYRILFSLALLTLSYCFCSHISSHITGICCSIYRCCFIFLVTVLFLQCIYRF